MKVAFAAKAGCLLPLCFLLSAETNPPRPAPLLVCDESEFFFAATPNTEIISHDFILSNEGPGLLHIPAVRADCGCVTTRLSSDTLLSGESAVLKVKFDLKGRSGLQLRRIIVESNDPHQPHLTLALIGEAIAPLEIVPSRIYWGNIHVAAAAEKSCEIRFHERDESFITSLTLSNSSFAAELITVKPLRIYKVVVRTVPPLSAGFFQSTLHLSTDHPRFQTLEIPMQGRIVGDIFSIPEEIVIESSAKDTISRALLICQGLKKKFKILRVELPAPEMKFNIRPLAMGGGWRIDLRNIAPSKDLDGACIVIFTDSETMPSVSVPIRFIPAQTGI